MNEEFDQMGFMVEFTDPEVHTLLYAVNEALRTWSGGDQKRQECLHHLKDNLFRMVLEMQFDPEA